MRPYERSLYRTGARAVTASAELCHTLLLFCALHGHALTLRLEVGILKTGQILACSSRSVWHRHIAQCYMKHGVGLAQHAADAVSVRRCVVGQKARRFCAEQANMLAGMAELVVRGPCRRGRAPGIG